MRTYNQSNNTALAQRQAGMTTIGLIILISFIGIFAYAGLRLVPVYLEDRKIAETFKNITNELAGAEVSKRDIYNSIYKRFDVDAVRVVTAKDIEIARVEGGYDVSLNYENRVPFMANIAFAVDFKHKTTVFR